MTTAKLNHKAARVLLLQHLDMHPGQAVGDDLDPAEVGIVGDTSHAEGGDSYHLGADQIRARNGRNRYSVDESARDKRGLDEHASAMDVGWFKVTTGRGTFTLRDYSLWLVALCKAGDPDTADLREVIYSPDGQTVRRWDRQGVRTSGDSSHLYHTHLSEFRDADGHRMLRLATRWLQHIGLIPEEDDDMAVTPADEAKIKAAAKAGFIEALADGYAAATGKASTTSAADRQKRNIRDFLRGIVGGPTEDDVAAAKTAIVEQLKTIGGPALSDEQVARLAQAVAAAIKPVEG